MAKLLQNVNLAGTALFLRISLGGDQALALPHITVPDVAWLDWAVLSRAGFRAAVFDKDNTLTAPFDLSLPPRIAAALSDAASALGGRGALALYSNSAGLQQYDPAGVEAGALEAALGLRVVRHTDKKPAGGVTELAAQLGCEPHEIVFVGDRYLTDVVFGNRHGMLTVRVAPLAGSSAEPPGVRAARILEEACVRRWTAGGAKAPAHRLLPPERVATVVRRPPSDDGDDASH